MFGGPYNKVETASTEEITNKAKEILFNLRDTVPGPNPHLDSLYAEFAALIGEEGLSNEELSARARELAQDEIKEVA